jgi:putative hydrolase of HD superfamily
MRLRSRNDHARVGNTLRIDNDVLTTLIELQRLKGLDRTGWTLRGLPAGTESVADHSFGVTVTAMFLADEIAARGVAIDVERVIRIALLHDWAESRVGDMPKTATDYFGAETRKRAEMSAFADIVESAGSSASLYREFYSDYEQRRSLEAKIVKVADVVDLLVQALALERAGTRGLDEFWDVVNTCDFQLEGAAGEVVSEVLVALLSARERCVK